MRDGWVETTLGELVSISTGKLDVNAEKEFGDYPFFTCAKEVYRIDIAAFDGEFVIIAGNGDLNVKYYNGKFNAYQRTYVIGTLDKNTLCNKFLYLFMQEYIDYLRSQSRGTTIQYLKKGQFTEAVLNLPPLAEQKRIVDLISSVDSYIEALQQQVDKARKSRNAVLHELLTKGGDGWFEKPIKELTEIRYGYTESANTENVGPKFLRITDIQEGKVEWDKVPFCIIRDKDLKLHKLQHGDLVFARTGATTGKSYLIQKPPEAVCASYLIRMRPLEEKVDSHFLSFFFQSIFYWDQLLSRKSGSAQGGVNASKLGQLKINLPPLAEQRKIVEIISVFDNQIEALDSTITKTKNLRSALLSDLLSGNHDIPMTYDKLIGAA